MTPGSVYNVEALRDHELEFALVQSDVAYDAYHGKAAFSGTPFSICARCWRSIRSS
jgi:TRAP-type uncharacterized transport system substrate-binding protein